MKAAKWFGALLLAGAAGVFLLAVLMCLGPLEDRTRMEALIPGLFFGSVALVPGVGLFWWGRAKEAEAEAEELLLGYVRSHDRFTSGEMATKLGRNEVEVEQSIVTLGNRSDLDLVFHRPDRAWMHRGRIKTAHAVVDKCGSCGANVGHQIVFEGESVACQYCDSPLKSP